MKKSFVQRISPFTPPVIIGLIFFGLYLIALSKPNMWWGLHCIYFIPPVWKFILLVISFLTIIFYKGRFLKRTINSIQNLKFVNEYKIVRIVAVSLVFGVIYYSFPMHESLYGDAELFKEKLGERTTEFSDIYVKHLLSPNVFSPKSGNTTTLSAVRLLSFYTDATHEKIFLWIGTVFGFMFVGLWLYFIQIYFKRFDTKMLFAIVVLTAPFTQFFFGFEEIYAPAYFFLSAYFILVLMYFRTRTIRTLILMAISLFLALKTHSSSFLLVPSFVLISLFHFWKDKQNIRKYFNWKYTILLFGIPIVVAGA